MVGKESKTKKKLNRNPFNEKLIHRYFFETVYLGSLDEKRSLVPDSLKRKISKLNLIVPEDKFIYRGYRADFTLYFKGDKMGVPVEIKWKYSQFKKPNQIKALEEKGGFLVTLDAAPNMPNHVKIEADHFKEWLIRRCDILWEEALSEKVQARTGDNTWVITLRGHAQENLDNMLKQCGGKNTHFWAFRNERKIMRNILNVKVGDRLLFLVVKTYGNERRAMISTSTKKLDLLEAHYGKVKDPYYMILGGTQATFFESHRNLPINERKWPHFIEFELDRSVVFKRVASLDRNKFSKDLRGDIADSYNIGGGSPVSMSPSDSQYLDGLIRSAKKREDRYLVSK